MYKPNTYNSVSPYLIVNNAREIVVFLKEVFNATELRMFKRPDGSIMHAEVGIDDSVIMMGEAGQDGPASSSHVHVYVPDVDVIYHRAIEWGATSIQAPILKADDPDKRGGVVGPGGNSWWISTQILQGQ